MTKTRHTRTHARQKQEGDTAVKTLLSNPWNENCQHFCLIRAVWGERRDAGGHGCRAAEEAARLKHKLVLSQIGSRMKLLFSLFYKCLVFAHSLARSLIFLLVFSSSSSSSPRSLCPLSIHLQLRFPLLTSLWTIMLISPVPVLRSHTHLHTFTF